MLGFLLSSLLKTAEEEVQAGLTGSKALATAALQVMRCLMEAVRDGDALAFVLPGLASGLSKIIIAAGHCPACFVHLQSLASEAQYAQKCTQFLQETLAHAYCASKQMLLSLPE